MKLILVESQKLHRKKIWTLSDKWDRFRKITILRPNFRNKLFSKLNLSKNIFNKSWCLKLKFFNQNFFRKIRTTFDIEKWLWKSEICNFITLSPLSEKVQKNFQCNFCDSTSISFIVISFHQIPLTWWNAYSSHCTAYQVWSETDFGLTALCAPRNCSPVNLVKNGPNKVDTYQKKANCENKLIPLGAQCIVRH